MNGIIKPLCALAFLLAGGIAHAGGFAYRPFGGTGFAGTQGYQELELAPDRWYLAYQGNRDTAADQVDAAWGLRAAQICMARGASSFVELRYPFESVGVQDATTGTLEPDPMAGWMLRQTAGAVMVPIYIPSAPQPVVPMTAPAKLAAIVCVRDLSTLKDRARATDATAATDRARELGVEIPR